MKMKRYMLQLSYIGTTYKSSERLNSKKILDLDSIQGAIESCLSIIKPITVNDINLIMAEHTNSGVHALSTAAHIDLEVNSRNMVDSKQLLIIINKFLRRCNHEIRITNFYKVNEIFHAKLSLKSKTYIYRFLVAKDPENYKIPISEYGRTLHVCTCRKDFNVEKLKNGITLLNKSKNIKKLFSNQRFLKTNLNNKFFTKITKILNIILEKSEPLLPWDPFSENFNYWNLILKSQLLCHTQIYKIIEVLFALGYNSVNETHILRILKELTNYNSFQVLSTPSNGLYLLNLEYSKSDVQEI